MLASTMHAAPPFGDLTPLVEALDRGAPVLDAAGMEPVRLILTGTAFFPVGRGLVRRSDWSLSDKPVMVLGQDFGTQAYVDALDKFGREEYVNSQTWRELRDLLPAARIPLEACFFTNVYMGLRREGPMVGVLPAARNAAYRAWCAEFLRLQLSVQRPQMVIVLGMEPARFFGSVFEVGAWNGKVSYKTLQAAEAQVQKVEMPHGEVSAVVIPHPSFLHANGGRCAWRGTVGRAALVRMLGDVFEASVPQ